MKVGWERAIAASGAFFSLGILIGDDTINGAGEAPSALDREGDSIADVHDYLGDAAGAASSGTYWIGRGVGTLALIALAVFTLYVARRIRQQDAGAELLPYLVAGGGLMAASLGLISAAAQFAVVARANEGIDVELARTMLDFSGIAFVLMWLPVALFLAAAAAASRAGRLFPRWLAVYAGALAAALLIGLAVMPAGNAGFFAIVLTFLWFIAASVTLIRRPAPLAG